MSQKKKRGPSKRKKRPQSLNSTALNPSADKHVAQYLHAKKRARERYNLHLTVALYTSLIADIKHGGSTHVQTQSNRTSVHVVSHMNNDYTVVYDKLRHTIVTFLPPYVD